MAAVDAVCAADPAVLADADTVVALHRQLDRLEAAAARAAAAFEAAGGPEADGARSAAHSVAAACRAPLATARRRVRPGRAVRHLPVAEDAWVAGDIGSGHVDALDRVRTPATQATLGPRRGDAGAGGQVAAVRLVRGPPRPAGDGG